MAPALWFLLLPKVFTVRLPVLSCSPTCVFVLWLKSALGKIGRLFIFWGIEVTVQHGEEKKKNP